MKIFPSCSNYEHINFCSHDNVYRALLPLGHANKRLNEIPEFQETQTVFKVDSLSIFKKIIRKLSPFKHS